MDVYLSRYLHLLITLEGLAMQGERYRFQIPLSHWVGVIRTFSSHKLANFYIHRPQAFFKTKKARIFSYKQCFA